MLEPLGPGRLRLARSNFLPPVLSPLIGAAERGAPLKPVVDGIVHILGFDSFLYGTSLVTRPDAEQKTYVFTTAPTEWVIRYDQRAYLEVDPRVRHVFESAMPFVWDQESERGKDPAVDDFLDDAAKFGVASGVALAVYSACEGHVACFFNSADPTISELRRYEISRNMPEIVMLSIYLHEAFMKTVVERGIPPATQGAPLSARERNCIAYAAVGLTSRHIADQMHISERMVELHFASARSKLGVANRQEAIAKAVADGIIRRGRLPGSEGNQELLEVRRKARGPAEPVLAQPHKA